VSASPMFAALCSPAVLAGSSCAAGPGAANSVLLDSAAISLIPSPSISIFLYTLSPSPSPSRCWLFRLADTARKKTIKQRARTAMATPFPMPAFAAVLRLWPSGVSDVVEGSGLLEVDVGNDAITPSVATRLGVEIDIREGIGVGSRSVSTEILNALVAILFLISVNPPY